MADIFVLTALATFAFIMGAVSYHTLFVSRKLESLHDEIEHLNWFIDTCKLPPVPPKNRSVI